MTLTVDLMLLIAAAICFGLAAIGIGAGRVNLIGLGLLLYVLTLLL
jgi:hypothetical protein